MAKIKVTQPTAGWITKAITMIVAYARKIIAFFTENPMPTETISPVPKLQFFTNDGKPAVGYKLFTYAAGTSTKLATYTDSTGVTPNSNPIVLDFRGEARVWLPPNTPYKYVFAPASDTDPPGAPIWTVDQVQNAQLLTLYGGTDTGSSNNYILNFTANFSAYTDGIVIYWIPANTNTGASTINVNGLGPVAIVDAVGNPISAGQIVAGQFATIAYINGEFALLSSNSVFFTGSYSGTLTGLTTSPTVTVSYTRTGNMVVISFGAQSGTSNTNAFSVTGMPEIIRPSVARAGIVLALVDNSVIQSGQVTIETSGDLTFSKGFDGSVFTSSGSKGTRPATVTYML